MFKKRQFTPGEAARPLKYAMKKWRCGAPYFWHDRDNPTET